MATFLTSEIVAKVEGLNSDKTLKRWTGIVKEFFGEDYFKIENIPFNRHGNRRPVIVYSLDDIKKFQQVADILASQPTNRRNLKEAIITAFTTDIEIIKQKEDWEMALEAITLELSLMQHEDKRLLSAIQEMNRKLSSLSDTIDALKSSKPKLFKTK